MKKKNRKHHNKSKKKHSSKNKLYISQQNLSLWQKIKNLLLIIINFFKNLFSKRKETSNSDDDKKNSLVISDPNFLNKVEAIITANQSVSSLTTPLYNAYISDPDIAKISRLVNGQIPVNEANLDFKNLMVSEEVVEHLLKSNKVSPKVKEKVQEIKDNIDRKKQRLHAQPGFKSKPSDKPKPRI